MCEVMQKYEKIAVNEKSLSTIQNLIKKNCEKNFILELSYTEDEYREAETLFGDRKTK